MIQVWFTPIPTTDLQSQKRLHLSSLCVDITKDKVAVLEAEGSMDHWINYRSGNVSFREDICTIMILHMLILATLIARNFKVVFRYETVLS